MKLEQQVCSLELAKKLKELGFYQESLFCWTELNGDWFIYYIDRDGGFSIPKDCEDKFISAYTVAELCNFLPQESGSMSLAIRKCSTGWFVGYENMNSTIAKNDTSLPNALAKMSIYFEENGLL